MRAARIATALAFAATCWPDTALAGTDETYGPIDSTPEVDDAGDGPGVPDVAREDKGPFFPIWGRKARERGIVLPPAFGVAGMVINNRQELIGSDLAVAIRKGGAPDADAPLIDLPFVVPQRLESHTSNYQAKADLWVLPFLDLYVALGKAKGHMDIEVAIDLDAFVPFPFCRPASPCGTVVLPFEADIDNRTFTVGGVLAYGSKDWFVSITGAKTVTVSSKERSDIHTTDIGARGGPSFHLGETVVFSPYVGADYFDFDAEVTGLVASGPLFENGDPISMRYRIALSPRRPWAAIMGGNLQLGRHWSMQGEYNWGQGSNRVVAIVTFRP